MMRGPLQTVRREAPANPFSRGSSFAGSSWQGPVGTEVVCVCVCALRVGICCLSEFSTCNNTNISPKEVSALPSGHQTGSLPVQTSCTHHGPLCLPV